MTPLSAATGSAKWSGYISPSTSDMYSFTAWKQSGISKLEISGVDLESYSGSTPVVNQPLYLGRGALYELNIELTEGGATNLEAGIILSWSTDPTAEEVVPTTAFQSLQRIGAGHPIYELEIIPTSVPNQSTVISGPTEVIAGETYTVTMQSKNGAGVAHVLDNDTYTVNLNGWWWWGVNL